MYTIVEQALYDLFETQDAKHWSTDIDLFEICNKLLGLLMIPWKWCFQIIGLDNVYLYTFFMHRLKFQELQYRAGNKNPILSFDEMLSSFFHDSENARIAQRVSVVTEKSSSRSFLRLMC